MIHTQAPARSAVDMINTAICPGKRSTPLDIIKRIMTIPMAIATQAVMLGCALANLFILFIMVIDDNAFIMLLFPLLCFCNTYVFASNLSTTLQIFSSTSSCSNDPSILTHKLGASLDITM